MFAAVVGPTVRSIALGGPDPSDLLRALDPELLRALPTLVAIGLAFGVATAVVQILVGAALVDAAAAGAAGVPTDVDAALATALRVAPPVLTLSVILGLGVIGVSGLVAAAVVAGAGIVLLAVIPVVLFVAASWALAPVAIVVEAAGPVASLRRSWSLAAGRRWRILGLFLVLGLGQLVLSLLAAIAAALVPVPSGWPDRIAAVVTGTLWAPAYWSALTVAYLTLRGPAPAREGGNT